jgi:predicted secreted protein
MSRSRLSLRLAAGSVAAVLVFAAFGCGDGGDPAGTSPETPAATAPAPTTASAPATAPSTVTGESVAGTPAVPTVELNPMRVAPESLTVAVGQQFAVVAEENPFAGFEWTYLGSGIAVTVVEDSSTYTPFDDTPEGRRGGGVREWRLTPTRAGEGWFDFTLARVSDGAAADSVRVDLTVTP